MLVLFDIDELRRAQTDLRAERDYARAIVETVHEPLVVLDGQLRVQSANSAFYAAFQVAPEDTEGRLLYDLGNGQWNIAGLREQLADVLSRNADFADFDVRHEFEAIGLKVMRLVARRITREGSNGDLILLAIEDRTEVARFEERARQHLAEVVEQDQRKTAFLALLAHELRNPLAPIRSALHVLDLDGVSQQTAQRMHATMERQVHQLTRLVDDLLDVARINQGRLELDMRRLDLVTLLREALDAAQPSFEAKGLELASILPDEPVPLDADATRLSQVVGNVLHNACKFTDYGGRITLTLERDGGKVVIRVSDSGIGMAADQLPRIFDMFTQIDSSTERSRSGLGLGLALVKELVEAHGGTVSAHERRRRPRQRVCLAPALAGRATPFVEVEAPPSHGPKSSPKHRILIVDDNRDGRRRWPSPSDSTARMSGRCTMGPLPWRWPRRGDRRSSCSTSASRA